MGTKFQSQGKDIFILKEFFGEKMLISGFWILASGKIYDTIQNR